MIFPSTFNKPILLVGNGARTAGASQLIYKFCEKNNIPALTTMNGVDLIQDNLHIGFIGTHGNRIANMILEECDLIISVGARLGIRQIGRYKEKFAPNASLVRADIDQFELSRNIKEDEKKYQMDAKNFMQLLLKEDIPDYSLWKKQCIKAKEFLDDFDKTEGNLAVQKISTLLPPNPVVSVDVGHNQCWCAQSLQLKGREGRIHISGGYGTMGCGLPFAIGSSISLNNQISFCITGDGGFQMNIQELETVRREKIPIKIFILNNRVLGKISEVQHVNHKDRYAQTTHDSGYTVPNFKKISEAYGIKAATLNSYKELTQHANWLTDNEPCLFDIMLSQDSILVPKIKWETSKIEPLLLKNIIQHAQYILRDTL